MPPDHMNHNAQPNPLEDVDQNNLLYMVGRIAGVVYTLPSRMDNFEASTNRQFEGLNKVLERRAEDITRVDAKVTRLEKRGVYIAGIISTLSAIGGAALAKIFWPMGVG